jgi:hypothetical protein
MLIGAARLNSAGPARSNTEPHGGMSDLVNVHWFATIFPWNENLPMSWSWPPASATPASSAEDSLVAVGDAAEDAGQSCYPLLVALNGDVASLDIQPAGNEANELVGCQSQCHMGRIVRTAFDA